MDMMDTVEVQGHTRKYRSRTQRPCDLCRSRKIQCKKQNDAPACQKCATLSKVCTFSLRPLKKKVRSVKDHSALEPMRGLRTPTQALMEGNDCDIAIESPFWRSLENNQLFSYENDRLLEAIDSTGVPLDPPRFSFEIDNNHIACSRLDPDQVAENSPVTPNDLLNYSLSPDHAMSRHEMRDATSYPEPSSLEFNGSADTPEAMLQVPICPNECGDVFSLNSRSNYSVQWVGLSSESDPYLLQHYEHDSRDIYPMFRLDFRRILDVEDRRPVPQNNRAWSEFNQVSRDIPVHFMMTNEEILQDTSSFQEKVLSSGNTQAGDIALLHKTVPPELGKRLLKMYCQYVHPRFPVLANLDFEELQNSSHTASTSIGVQSAVYALATSYMFLDDELSLTTGYSGVSSETLWAIAYRCYHREKSSARFSLLKLCLLLMQRPPDNFAVSDSPNMWELSCSVLAIAETLGLNMDPQRWKLPREEIKLRRRLWWLTYTQHVWHACAFGRSVHIDDNNWDVTHLTTDDFNIGLLDSQDEASRSKMTQHISIFIAECRMAEILADVLKEFYTLAAIRKTSSLDDLLNRALPLRRRIETWRQTLPLLSIPVTELSIEDLETSASIRLSHIVVEVLIFRALLRPLVHRFECPAESLVEPLPTIFETCYICAKAGVDLISSMTAQQFVSFYPSYTRHQICYISSFILLSFVHSAHKYNAEKNKALLFRWRNTLRTQSRAWNIARLATIRLDAVFWKGLQSVVHGTGPNSPATTLLRKNSG